VASWSHEDTSQVLAMGLCCKRGAHRDEAVSCLGHEQKIPRLGSLTSMNFFLALYGLLGTPLPTEMISLAHSVTSEVQ
jgi:hypothetical protein